MDMTIPFKGKVKFPIMLDVGVWIFDDRRVDMDTYFSESREEVDENEEYIKVSSKNWDREIQEGAIQPPTLKSERKFEKEKVLKGTFGIPLSPFLNNAEPYVDAKWLIIETNEEDVTLPIEKANEIIMEFSKVGKPLKEDGPVHIYFKNGSNKNHPIKYIRAFRIE
jgi:hypothetical protein